jgi:hypothetical protein
MEGSGSVLATNGSGCGSGRPKNIRNLRIRIHNTAEEVFFSCNVTPLGFRHYFSIKSSTVCQKAAGYFFKTPLELYIAVLYRFVFAPIGSRLIADPNPKGNGTKVLLLLLVFYIGLQILIVRFTIFILLLKSSSHGVSLNFYFILLIYRYPPCYFE